MASGAASAADIMMSGTTPLGVSTLVSRFGGGQPLPRHGIAERGRFRQRSRERFSSHPATSNRSQTQDLRAHPTGPQKTVDWLQALEDYETRLATAERLIRMHAQTIAAMEEMNGKHRAATKNCNDDIVQYKNYVENKFKQVAEAFEAQRLKTSEIDNAIQIGINETLNILTEKCRILDVAHSSLVDFVHRTAQNEAARNGSDVANFNIGTQARPDPLVERDPWITSAPNRNTVTVAQLPAAACAGDNLLDLQADHLEAQNPFRAPLTASVPLLIKLDARRLRLARLLGRLLLEEWVASKQATTDSKTMLALLQWGRLALLKWDRLDLSHAQALPMECTGSPCCLEL